MKMVDSFLEQVTCEKFYKAFAILRSTPTVTLALRPPFIFLQRRMHNVTFALRLLHREYALQFQLAKFCRRLFVPNLPSYLQ